MTRLVIVAASLVLAGGFALAGATSGSKPYSQLAGVSEDARLRENPLEHDSDAVQAGRKLYERHCGDCHGPTAESGRKGPSLRAAEIQTASAGALFSVITHGNVRAGMPVWSRLPEPQRWQIVTYLKSLGQPSSAPPEPGPAPGR